MSFSKQPKNPVDQFEIHCFSVSDFDVVEHRYLYHVNTKWNVLYPDGGNGADFEDSWQHFRNGEFSGRYDGWPLGFGNNALRFFETRREALALARKQLGDRIMWMKAEVEQLEERLATTTAELEKLWPLSMGPREAK